MKIICKKNFTYANNVLIFHIWKWYKIEAPKLLYDKYVIIDDKEEVIWFMIDDNEKEETLEYFYTEKEYRKIKLDKINENRGI